MKMNASERKHFSRCVHVKRVESANYNGYGWLQFSTARPCRTFIRRAHAFALNGREMTTCGRGRRRLTSGSRLVDASASTFAVTHVVVSQARQLSYCKEANLNSKERGQLAAPLRGMHAWLPRSLMQSVSSRFAPYCPISWVQRQELVIVDGTSAHFAVEAGGMHYQLSDQACVDSFLADPQPTIDGPELPVARPRQLKPEEADTVAKTSFAYEGYCPVTLKDGPAPGAPAHTAVQRGQKPWVVEYKSTMYVCRDAASASRFMRKPEMFLGLKLPDNLPVRVEDLDMSTLPLTQYLDVTVVQVLSQGLVALGATKPLFPYSSREDSAKVCVG